MRNGDYKKQEAMDTEKLIYLFASIILVAGAVVYYLVRQKNLEPVIALIGIGATGMLFAVLEAPHSYVQLAVSGLLLTVWIIWKTGSWLPTEWQHLFRAVALTIILLPVFYFPLFEIRQWVMNPEEQTLLFCFLPPVPVIEIIVPGLVPALGIFVFTYQLSRVLSPNEIETHKPEILTYPRVRCAGIALSCVFLINWQVAGWFDLTECRVNRPPDPSRAAPLQLEPGICWYFCISRPGCSLSWIELEKGCMMPLSHFMFYTRDLNLCRLMSWFGVDNGRQLAVDNQGFALDPLRICVGTNWRQGIAYLERRGARLDAQNQAELLEYSYSYDGAMGVEIHLGDPKLIEMLIDKGISVDSRTKRSFLSPLQWASSKLETGLVAKLLERGANPDSVGRFKGTPLMIAAGKGGLQIVELLIRYGANSFSKDGSSPAMKAACAGGHLTVAKYLADQGVYISSQGEWGTLLHLAACRGRTDVARWLVESGVSLDVLNKDGDTALYLASMWKHYEITKILLEKGADINPEGAKKSAEYRIYWARSQELDLMVLDQINAKIDNEIEEEMVELEEFEEIEGVTEGILTYDGPLGEEGDDTTFAADETP